MASFMAKKKPSPGAALETLRDSGRVVGDQLKIMTTLVGRGSATSGEVLKTLGVTNLNAWRARFTELRERGLIREVGTRRCLVGGRICVVWAPSARDKPLEYRPDRKADARTGRAANAELLKLADELALALDATGVRSQALADYRQYRSQSDA